MLFISARKDFWDSTKLSDEDEIRQVNLTDSSLGTQVSPVNLAETVSGKNVLLLVHGYNNEEDDVVRAYNIIETKTTSLLKKEGGTPIYDEIIGYSWPGGDDSLDYFAAKRRASAVAPRLTRWLANLRASAASIDVMSHSMGCRLSLLALAGNAAGNGPVRNLYLTAAAVDNESLERGEEYFSSAHSCAATYVFHSKHDMVLNASFRGGERDAALGFSGPENPAEIIEYSQNIKVVNCKNVVFKHGGYKNCAEINTYISREFGSKPAPKYFTL